MEGARNPALAWQCEWEAAKEGVAYVACVHTQSPPQLDIRRMFAGYGRFCGMLARPERLLVGCRTAGKTNCLTGEFYQRPKERSVAKMATAIWGKLKDD